MFSLSRLEKKDIFVDIPETNFKSIIFYIIKNSRFPRKKEAFEGIIAREEMGTTAIGNNVAIPHCRLKNFSGIYVKVALFKENLGYVTPNGEEVRFMFLIIGSEDDTGYYLRTLSHIAKIMKNSNIQKELVQAKNKREIRQIFCKHENEELEKVYTWK